MSRRLELLSFHSASQEKNGYALRCYGCYAHATSYYFSIFITICLSSVVSELERFIDRKSVFLAFYRPQSPWIYDMKVGLKK